MVFQELRPIVFHPQRMIYMTEMTNLPILWREKCQTLHFVSNQESMQ